MNKEQSRLLITSRSEAVNEALKKKLEFEV